MHQPATPQPAKSEPPSSLAPLSVIRTETVLSRLPIHNLAKRGSVNIHIVKKDEHGEVDLLWRVSPSRDYGEPRQLAYKLDTLVINRRIEEEQRPLPKILKLESLRKIGTQLSIPANTDSIKNAFHQNAGTYITAKLHYIGNDGTQRILEAGFTRYSVIFTGERLPDGRKADAVYLILNEPYWEVLNNAPTRPLNYDYLKALTPAAQRFYEIISYKIFAAIKYQHPTAKISYSEYCTFSAQQRYADYDHIKKQMYKVHKPHLKSGYLKRVMCEATTDADGNPDWTMYYAPGPKAVAEFKAFNKKHQLSDTTAADAPDAENLVATAAEPDTGETQARELVAEFYQRFHKVKNTMPQQKELRQAAQLISAHGMEKARHILNYCYTHAPGTKFEPQIFGGILHYTGRAVADFEKRQKSRQTAAAAAQCILCNGKGIMSVRDEKRSYISVQCSHNLEQMQAYAESKGYKIEVRNQARDVAYEA